tara:strand:+ start:1037 stop:2098 length:1062 start_codon:yes stop_codon:yes gene_type:complete
MGYYSYSTMGGFEEGRDSVVPEPAVATEEETPRGIMTPPTSNNQDEEDNNSFVSNVTNTAKALASIVGKAALTINPVASLAASISGEAEPTTQKMQPVITESIKPSFKYSQPDFRPPQTNIAQQLNAFRTIEKQVDWKPIHKQYYASPSADEYMGLPGLTRVKPIRRPFPEPVSNYIVLSPSSTTQRLLKRKEADNYSTLYENAEKDTKGQFRGVDITQMTLKQVLAFQRKRGPKSFLQYNIDKYKKDTTAAGKYQFVGRTLNDILNNEDSKYYNSYFANNQDLKFNKETQDKIFVDYAQAALRGKETTEEKIEALKGIWEGFISADNQTLNRIIQEFEEDAKSSRPTRRPTK